MKLTEAQTRILRTLSHDTLSYGVPVGLSDLSNYDFTDMVTAGLISMERPSIACIVAHITSAGRAALAQGDAE